jgi:recombination protein RecA
MARPKKEVLNSPTTTTNDSTADDFAKQLISDLNKEFGSRIAYNLNAADAPTIVKNWINSRSLLLNYAMANKRDGGYPGGRIIEIAGLPSTGKSHLAYEAARSVQEANGLVVYIDTENATPVEKLGSMGIDITKKFVYVDTHCTEEVFSVLDSIIRKAKSIVNKNVPVLAIWDSVAGTSPKAELEGEYDQNTMGLQARVLSKGFRKITGLLGETGVTLICINQLRSKLNASPYGDPYVSPGGAALPYHASIRIRLTGEGSPIKDKNGNVIGIKVPLKIQKNKVAPPGRNFSIEIHFGKGISEVESLLDVGMEYTKVHEGIERDGKIYKMFGAMWRTFQITTKDGEIVHEQKFQRTNFGDLLYNDPVNSPLLMDFYDSILTQTFGEAVDSDNPDSPDLDEEGNSI